MTFSRRALAPSVAETRLAVRKFFEQHLRSESRVIVAFSGGADSLALTAAVAFEAPGQGVTVQGVVIDHGLQNGSSVVAHAAVAQARSLGVSAEVCTVTVSKEAGQGGLEAAAREARYEALSWYAVEHKAQAVMLGHTLDDQAETVLLGLARGSGAASLQGMAPVSTRNGVMLARPFLGVRRVTSRDACRQQELSVWDDPHNTDERFARVRARERVLPVLEEQLGPGITEALARTAEQLREDTAVLDGLSSARFTEIAEPLDVGVALPVQALEIEPAAIRNRIIRLCVAEACGQSITRRHTLEISRLITDWSGQGPLNVPGARVWREHDRLIVRP